jgi:hypothetical protein
MGSPTTFVRHLEREVKAGRTEAKVPCNGCNRCCRAAGLNVDLLDHERPKYRCHLDEELDTHVLDKNLDGSCVYLVDGKCSIYAERPQACRLYDCRVPALLGFIPHDDPLVIEGVGQWYPELKTVDDRDALVAIRLCVDRLMAGGREPDLETLLPALASWRAFLPLARQIRRSLEALPRHEAQALLDNALSDASASEGRAA